MLDKVHKKNKGLTFIKKLGIICNMSMNIITMI